jgi:hypothetical protein
MQTSERVARLTKAVDDMYANLYLWHQLDRTHQQKVVVLYNKMGTQPGISQSKTRFAEKDGVFKKGIED